MSANFLPIDAWPCTWPCDISFESPAITGQAVLAATQILHALSGQRFGVTTVKLRPCRRSCRATSFPGGILEPWPGVGYGPLFGGIGWWATWGGVIGADCGTCSGACSCTLLSEIKMPAVVNEILQVKVDGAPLATGGSAYHVDDNRFLVRTDGKAWPYCQNLALDDDQPGTYSVTGRFGLDVPDAARLAVGELACEWLRARNGDACQLPANITSVARQGVTITLPDLTAVIKENRLGLRWCDMWIQSVNPKHLTARSRPYSVDGTLARRSRT